ncbi:Na(+)/H(+) exchange regulatory cofactor NHE-RF3 [Frankliniella fusca]|uniref:Na(+)/H(+) exchange regulatory cofactor NHE-RF3 n=1 Tax=Frankliniella fusca TaxID=407009 RepID=A0AAE1HSM5_9NEOP|nr:Na(+)/H(+) exchange regulatory cofactor NHE-RF3 [Frankliniella fusca]
MYKPLTGKTNVSGSKLYIAAFLSKGAVDGSILSKLCLEATALIEQSGFNVDMWVCDGDSWNRVMWNKMGLKNLFAYQRPSKTQV